MEHALEAHRHEASQTALPGMLQLEVMHGITLSVLDLQAANPMEMQVPASPHCIEFNFVLAGEASAVTKTRHHSSTLTATPNTTIACYMPEGETRFTVLPDRERVRMLGVSLDLASMGNLLGFAPHAKLEHCLDVNRRCEMTADQRLATYQIFTCAKQGMARRVFLHGKALELLSTYLDAIEDGRKAPDDPPLSRNEQECIHRARMILRGNMASPPALEELASEAGLPLRKLKEGFRRVFRKTPFACLHEDRMQHAYELLSDGAHNVSEAAWEVGYTNVGHFSTAFRRHFGMNPKSFQMNIRGKRRQPDFAS